MKVSGNDNRVAVQPAENETVRIVGVFHMHPHPFAVSRLVIPEFRLHVIAGLVIGHGAILTYP